MSDDIAVRIDPEDPTITITGHGCAIPMSFDDARTVAETIHNLLSTWDVPPYRSSGLELLAERYGPDAVNGREVNPDA